MCCSSHDRQQPIDTNGSHVKVIENGYGGVECPEPLAPQPPNLALELQLRPQTPHCRRKRELVLKEVLHILRSSKLLYRDNGLELPGCRFTKNILPHQLSSL